MSAHRHPVIVAAAVLALAVGFPLVPAAASEQTSGAAFPARKLTTSQLAAKMLTGGEVRAATGLTEFQSFSAPRCQESTSVTFCMTYGAYSGTFPATLVRIGGVSVESYRTSKVATSMFARQTDNYKKAAKAGKVTGLVSNPTVLSYTETSGSGTVLTFVMMLKGSNVIRTNCNDGTDAARRSCATKLATAQASKLSGATLATSAAPPAPAPADGSDPSQSPDSGGTPEVTDSEFSPGGA